jgi:hypothetical protein
VIDCLALTVIIRDRAAEPVGELVSGSYHRNIEYVFEDMAYSRCLISLMLLGI